MKKINLEDLKQEAPLFSVPENYFDTLPSKIQNSIQKRKEKTVWYQAVAVQKYWKISTALCAVVLSVFVATELYMPKAQTENLSEVSEQAIKEYLVNSGIATDDIVQVCATQGTELNIDAMPIDISQELLEEELNLEDINDYL
jgi:hypothetical protein